MERIKRIEAIEMALNIACLVKQGVCKLREKAWVWDGENHLPHILEFLIFGSAAQRQDEEEVGDLDMILIDNGYFSKDFTSGSTYGDWYALLQNNLTVLLSEHFSDNGDVAKELMESRVDLHILPLKFFKDKKYRHEVAMDHKDPFFFQNCFSSMLRLKGFGFVPVNIGYFEKKYFCKLDDLKSR